MFAWLEMPDSTALSPRVRIDRVFADDDRRALLHDETFWGLRDSPKQIPAKWLYDERGSGLFDEITRLPEYYATRCEREILETHAREIAELTQAATLVELGSGTSEKTALLLDALESVGTLARFVPVDVSEQMLVASAYAIADRYRGLEVHAVVGDFERHLGATPTGGVRMVAFLGSTIGNLSPQQRLRFLESVAAVLLPGEWLLLGVDLVKDAATVEAAYNDVAGLTEAFIRNGLEALDRELGSGLASLHLDYEARWRPERSWVDLGLRSSADQRVEIPKLEVELALEAGEFLRVEVSTKFERAALEVEFSTAGLALERWWTDASNRFAVCLALRPEG